MTTPPRTARPLPRYVRRKALASGAWAHFFEIPSWARKAGCKVANEALGTNYAAAVARAEDVLLPAFDSWRTKGASDLTPKRDEIGTLDWAFRIYRESKKFADLSRSMQRTHELGFGMVGSYVLRDGRRLGAQPLTKINTALVDKLHEKLLVVVDADGVARERTTTVNHAMKSCRRAWNVAFRAHPEAVPALNPFSKMGLVDVSKPTPTATFEELQAFVAACDGAGRPSLGTAALIAWEWLQREEDIFGTFSAEHYRPKGRPDAVHVLHDKTGAEAWFPLFDEVRDAAGRLLGTKQLYPVLQARLDALKTERITGLMLVRDWVDRGAKRPLPWPSAKGDLSFLRHEVKDLIRAAGIRDELTFQSFRHGGMTEGGDAELTDRELLAQSRHTTTKVLPLYTKRTMRQVASGARKRLASRTKAVDVSE